MRHFARQDRLLFPSGFQPKFHPLGQQPGHEFARPHLVRHRDGTRPRRFANDEATEMVGDLPRSFARLWFQLVLDRSPYRATRLENTRHSLKLLVHCSVYGDMHLCRNWVRASFWGRGLNANTVLHLGVTRIVSRQWHPKRGRCWNIFYSVAFLRSCWLGARGST